MATATLRDVAKAAGVHPATVSRALNPETRSMVNAETARRVERAAESLGYRPNPIARSLKTQRSGIIGVVVPDLTNPLFPPIVRGIDKVLDDHGYATVVVNTDSDDERERTLVDSLRSRQVEGLILATARTDHPLLAEVSAQTPIVLVGRVTPGMSAWSVTNDDRAGVEAAVAHLVGQGHRRIACLAGPSSTSTGLVRLRAYRHALLDHGITPDPELEVECSRWSEASGADALRELLDRDTAATAVVAGNDLIALGCYDVLRERGIVCPDDLSVVGFNDMLFVDKVSPPLTTVHGAHFQAGCEAARLMLAQLAERDLPPRQVVLPVELVERGSTAPPRA